MASCSARLHRSFFNQTDSDTASDTGGACDRKHAAIVGHIPSRGKMRPQFKSVVVSDIVEKTSTRRRSRIPCVVVEKITTRQREGVRVVVEKMKKVDELSTKIRVIYLQQ